MEFFNNAKAVCLRSHLDKYLVADKDQENVRQSRKGSRKEARWLVEFVEENPRLIRLKSCHGKYLCASNDTFLFGMNGKKVVQSLPVSNRKATMEWEPIKEAYKVRLRTEEGGELRANGGINPWKNSVTHDLTQVSMTQDWALWQVEVVNISKTHSSSVEDLSSEISTFDNDDNDDDTNSTISHTQSVLLERSISSISQRSINSTSLLRSPRQSPGMEFFKKSKLVRLRSHYKKHLIADEDEEKVLHLEPYGIPVSASWTVECVNDFDNVLRLKSCFGTYLTATEERFRLGATGRIVKQTMPKQLDSSVEWEPIQFGAQVKLKTRIGSYLGANGGVPPPWNSSITHDKPYSNRHANWALWEVEVVEIRQEPPKKIPKLESVDQDFSSNKLLLFFFISIMSLFFLAFILH